MKNLGRLTGLAAAGLLSIGLLTGCAGGGDPEVPPAGQGSAPTAVPTAPIPGKGGVSGARGDLAGGACTFADGRWGFTGTLTNSQETPQAYSVRLSVRNVKDSRVLGVKVIDKTIEPGKQAKVAEAEILRTDDDKGLDCVISVTRTKA